MWLLGELGDEMFLLNLVDHRFTHRSLRERDHPHAQLPCMVHMGIMALISIMVQEIE